MTLTAHALLGLLLSTATPSATGVVVREFLDQREFGLEGPPCKTASDTCTPGLLWLIMFHVPTCGHCRALAPVLAEIAADIPASVPVRIGRVDCSVDSNMMICARNAVAKTPWLVLQQGDTSWVHRGARERADIEAAIARLRTPPVTEGLSTLDELPSYSDHDVQFVMVRSATDDHQRRADGLFAKVARRSMHEAVFGTTHASDLVARLAAVAGNDDGDAAGVDELAEVSLPIIAKLEAGVPTGEVLAAAELDGMMLEGKDPEALLHRWVYDLRMPLLVTTTTWRAMATVGKQYIALLMVDPCSGSNQGNATAAAETAPPPLSLLSGDASTEEPTCTLALTTPDLAKHAAATALRRAKRSHATKINFGVVDAASSAGALKFAGGFHTGRAQMPRLVVLDMSEGVFYRHDDDSAAARGGAGDASAYDEFLRRVVAGEVYGEAVGKWWGMPDRTWRQLKLWVPALASLDMTIPRHSFNVPLAIVVAMAAFRLLRWAGTPRAVEVPGADAKKED